MARKESKRTRKTGETASRKSSGAAVGKGDAESADDAMSRCVALCQEGRWREALLLCRKAIEKAEKNGRGDVVVGMRAAQVKIDRSLRRQMIGALIGATSELLKKEYLLDVPE